jgi:hypothetical protein
MDAHHQPGSIRKLKTKTMAYILLEETHLPSFDSIDCRLDRVGDRSAEDIGTSLVAELSLESSAFMKDTRAPCPLNASSKTSIPRCHNMESNASSQTSVPRSHNMESNMHLRPAVAAGEGSSRLGLLSGLE